MDSKLVKGSMRSCRPSAKKDEMASSSKNNSIRVSIPLKAARNNTSFASKVKLDLKSILNKESIDVAKELQIKTDDYKKDNTPKVIRGVKSQNKNKSELTMEELMGDDLPQTENKRREETTPKVLVNSNVFDLEESRQHITIRTGREDKSLMTSAAFDSHNSLNYKCRDIAIQCDQITIDNDSQQQTQRFDQETPQCQKLTSVSEEHDLLDIFSSSMKKSTENEDNSISNIEYLETIISSDCKTCKPDSLNKLKVKCGITQNSDIMHLKQKYNNLCLDALLTKNKIDTIFNKYDSL